MTSTDQSPTLMNLPVEIQELIYEHVYQPWFINLARNRPSSPIHLLLTCRSIYTIAQPVRDQAFMGLAGIESPSHITRLASNPRLTAMIHELILNRNVMLNIPIIQILQTVPNLGKITMEHVGVTEEPLSIHLYQPSPNNHEIWRAVNSAGSLAGNTVNIPNTWITVVDQTMHPPAFRIQEGRGNLMRHQVVISSFFNGNFTMTAKASFNLKRFVYWAYGMPYDYVEIDTLAEHNNNVDQELEAVPVNLQFMVTYMKQKYREIWGPEGHNAVWRRRQARIEEIEDDEQGDDDEFVGLRLLEI